MVFSITSLQRGVKLWGIKNNLKDFHAITKYWEWIICVKWFKEYMCIILQKSTEYRNGDNKIYFCFKKYSIYQRLPWKIFFDIYIYINILKISLLLILKTYVYFVVDKKNFVFTNILTWNIAKHYNSICLLDV